MLRLLPGTASIFLTFLVIAAAFIGCGLALRRAFGLKAAAVDDVLLAFWTGFAAVVLFLILWNFALPVNGVTLTVVLAGGATGLGITRGAWWPLVARRARPWPFGTLALIAAAGLWIANMSVTALVNWDSTLYHLQGVEWAHTYAVVPGLANLLGPLGFNNCSWLYDAMLDAGFWSGRAWHVAEGVFVFMLAAQAIVGAQRFLRDDSPRRAAHLFAFLLLAYVFYAILGNRVASFDTDLPPSMLLLVITARWYGWLSGERREPREEAYELFCLVTLCAAAVTLKMNAAIFGLVTVITATTLWLRQGANPAPLVRRAITWSLAVSVAMGIAWMARGVVLSGYALFPSRLISLPVAWRVPAAHAQAEFDYVVYSGRAATLLVDVMAGRAAPFAWVPNWIGHLSDDLYFIPVPVVLALVALIVGAVGRRGASPAARAHTQRAWWILLPFGIAWTAWFLSSPEPRYVAAGMWALFALASAQAYRLWHERVSVRAARMVAAAGWIIAISPLVVAPLRAWMHQGAAGNPLTAIIRANVVIPPPGEWFVPPFHGGEMTKFTTRSGLVLNVPTGRCWDMPLPCTHNPAPNLRLRVPGRLDKGFVVDGPWAMEHWPEPWRPQIYPAWLDRWHALGHPSP